MAVQQAYMIMDIGTGNVRVAVAGVHGEILSVERDNVHYEKDERYPDALYFEPNRLWKQIVTLAGRVLQQVPDAEIEAITVSSQREGVVLLGRKGESLMGLPNHDHRGREWENTIADKDLVYRLTGRYPTSLFSALKLMGLKNKRPELYAQFTTLVSISDWAQYQLSGIAGYEHSQASETMLYEVAGKRWSKELCSIFGIEESVLPKLHASGTVLGKILPDYAAKLNISPQTVIVVGGADTQLAIKSTQPSIEDIVMVSGTTTPIAKIIDEYILDPRARTWTNRHIEEDRFILEANTGVTGLNYQRLKEIFYPNESYEIIEKELTETPPSQCVASLGSLIADEKVPLTKGGFIFNTPVSHQLNRACFVWATLWDIACCIKENYESLCEVREHKPDYVWACGGGLQSPTLRQFIANLIGKKVQIREGFQQSSVVGGALVCNKALGVKATSDTAIQVVNPQDQEDYQAWYAAWKKVRTEFKQIF